MSDTWTRSTGRLQSFRHAFTGVCLVLRTQPNAWIHAVATVLVVALGVYFDVSAVEWTVLLLAAVAVWVAEAANTALELMGDAVSPDFNPTVGKAKDAAAASVLIAAVGAAVIGTVVLGPYLFAALR